MNLFRQMILLLTLALTLGSCTNDEGDEDLDIITPEDNEQYDATSEKEFSEEN